MVATVKKGEEAFLKKILGEEYTGNVTEDTKLCNETGFIGNCGKVG